MMRCYVRRIDDRVTEPAILAAAAPYDAIEDDRDNRRGFAHVVRGDEIVRLFLEVEDVVDVLPQLSVMLPGLFDEPMRQGCGV